MENRLSILLIWISVFGLIILSILTASLMQQQSATTRQIVQMASSTAALKKQADNTGNVVQLLIQTPEINAVATKEYQRVLDAQKPK